MLKFFYVMGKALSGELFCMWIGLVNKLISLWGGGGGMRGGGRDN